MTDIPTEEAMNNQSFKTMVAMERMANAVTDYLTADKQPAKQSPVACGVLKNRSTGRPETYGKPCKSVVQHICARCGTLRCKGHVYACVDGGMRCAGDAASECGKVFEGDVIVRGKLRVDGDARISGNAHVGGTTTTVDAQTVPGPMAPLDGDLKEIREMLDRHRKALSIIGVLGGFENARFGQTEPGRMVRSLVGLSVCRECNGTGWIARDEQCKNCKSRGYLEP
jgi:hypothetical protein